MGLPLAEDVDDEPFGFIIDLYILDINLPGEDGISLARRIRRSQPEVGIVVVSARAAIADRVSCYEIGANLYLVKPLSLDELRAVVSGFGRRITLGSAGAGADFTLSPLRMLVSGPKGEARLTQSELVVLASFSRSAQQSLEHWQIASLFGSGGDISKENVEVKVGRLRKKLIACGAPAPGIQSMRGVGYRLCVHIEVMSI
ncbi:transcriptional regulator (plasmid) [Gemmobacter aquarius]|uniref:Transcriptional regulator n=1 Tax=Paragemmobacter aquarius TaxID=2169400 RepID=A0A2S0URZ4_9RHOB|nr:response regulator transcription factor [Gemmobacter aquarius]AWB50542.1 transcriptional regulator [Gemmobacter aquarius]